MARLTGDPEAFKDSAWGSRIHLHRATPDDVGRLLDLADVDHLLTGAGIRTPSVRVVQDGSVLPTSHFTKRATLAGASVSGLVDPRKVLDCFDSGATVVLQGLHRHWPPVAGLVRQLELALGHPCQANAYLTPPGAQGFARHSDTHDVFVVQTFGNKTWQAGPEPAATGDPEAGPQKVAMEPGACLYLPAGTPHAARTEEGTSLHLTVGVHNLRWRDLLQQAATRALGPDVDGSLPAGYLDDPEVLARGLGDRLQQLAAALAEEDPGRLARAQVERFLTSRPAHLPGALSDRVAQTGIHDDTWLHRRPGAVLRLCSEPDRLRVLLGDRALVMPSWLQPAMALVEGRHTLRPRDLSSWLDPSGRRVLTVRLVREGLLQVDHGR